MGDFMFKNECAHVEFWVIALMDMSNSSERENKQKVSCEMSRQQVSEKWAIYKHKSKSERPELKEAAEEEKAASKNSFLS